MKMKKHMSKLIWSLLGVVAASLIYPGLVFSEETGLSLARPLTLEECIEAALAANPQLGRQYWSAQGAEARRAAAAARLRPALGLGGGQRRYLDGQRLVSARSPGEAGTWSEDILSADLTIRIPLDNGRRLGNELRAAELLEQAAGGRLARTRGELVYQVSNVFYSILGQRRVIASLEFSRQALEEHRKRVEDLMGAQKAARVDLLRTEVRLADLGQKLVRVRNTLNIQRQVLASLMGIDGVAVPEVAGELSLARYRPADDPLAVAYAQRGDWLATQAEAAAQERRAAAARAARRPALAATGSYSRRWARDDTTIQPGAGDTEDLGSVGLSLDLPLFDGGRLEASVRQEEAKLEEERERLRELELKIRLEVQTALLNLISGLQRVEATEKAIEQARESLRIERERYELGTGSIVDVLDAQAALLDAETNNAQVLAEHNISLAYYRLATGEKP